MAADGANCKTIGLSTREEEIGHTGRQGGALGLLNSDEGDREGDSFPDNTSNQVRAYISSPKTQKSVLVSCSFCLFGVFCLVGWFGWVFVVFLLFRFLLLLFLFLLLLLFCFFSLMQHRATWEGRMATKEFIRGIACRKVCQSLSQLMTHVGGFSPLWAAPSLHS